MSARWALDCRCPPAQLWSLRLHQRKDKLWKSVGSVAVATMHAGTAFPTVLYWREVTGRAGYDPHGKLVHWIKRPIRCGGSSRGTQGTRPGLIRALADASVLVSALSRIIKRRVAKQPGS